MYFLQFYPRWGLSVDEWGDKDNWPRPFPLVCLGKGRIPRYSLDYQGPKNKQNNVSLCASELISTLSDVVSNLFDMVSNLGDMVSYLSDMLSNLSGIVSKLVI